MNATPLGLYPNIEDKPAIDYESVSNALLVCDVIPNTPKDTVSYWIRAHRGAQILEDLGMLVQ